jgi:hypothetical protein
VARIENSSWSIAERRRFGVVVGANWKNENRTGVVEMNIGKWYDPISERWFVPREGSSFAVCSPSAEPPSAERVLEIHRMAQAKRTQAKRIWELLVESCAHR